MFWPRNGTPAVNFGTLNVCVEKSNIFFWMEITTLTTDESGVRTF